MRMNASLRIVVFAWKAAASAALHIRYSATLNSVISALALITFNAHNELLRVGTVSIPSQHAILSVW
jgi:hypothetical protein